MNIKLAENIKSLRAERGLSQKELATRLSVSPQAISRWENGLAYPDMEMLPRLADIFQVSVDRLFGREISFIAQRKKSFMRHGVRLRVTGIFDICRLYAIFWRSWLPTERINLSFFAWQEDWRTTALSSPCR